MFRDTTKRQGIPTGWLFVALFALAALPPAALFAMQQQARQPVPYLTIELGGEPSPMATQEATGTLSAER